MFSIRIFTIAIFSGERDPRTQWVRRVCLLFFWGGRTMTWWIAKKSCTSTEIAIWGKATGAVKVVNLPGNEKMGELENPMVLVVYRTYLKSIGPFSNLFLWKMSTNRAGVNCRAPFGWILKTFPGLKCETQKQTPYGSGSRYIPLLEEMIQLSLTFIFLLTGLTGCLATQPARRTSRNV